MKKTLAFSLRNYPFNEVDRVVSFFSQDYGLIKGIARGSLKQKSKISGALEPFTMVNLRFIEPHGKEMILVTGCDAISSLYHQIEDVRFATTLALITEITTESHAEHNADPAFFRLLMVVHRALVNEMSPQLVSRYFELFTLKLTGIMPPLSVFADQKVVDLVKRMLKTNLLDLGDSDYRVLHLLGRQLRKEIRQAIGKPLKSYSFLERTRINNAGRNL